MNPASRLYDFLNSLLRHSSKNRKMIDVYKEIFDTDDLYRVYELLHFQQKNLAVIEKELTRLNKIDKYKKLLNHVKIFVLPTSLEAYISSHKSILELSTPQFMILADSFENPKHHEQDVSNDLKSFSEELDKFLDTLMSLDIDEKSKKILLLVVHKIKISISNYNYIGILALQENLLFFECILSTDKKTVGILTKLSNIVKKAKDVQDIVAFMSDSSETMLDLLS